MALFTVSASSFDHSCTIDQIERKRVDQRSPFPINPRQPNPVERRQINRNAIRWPSPRCRFAQSAISFSHSLLSVASASFIPIRFDACRENSVRNACSPASRCTMNVCIVPVVLSPQPAGSRPETIAMILYNHDTRAHQPKMEYQMSWTDCMYATNLKNASTMRSDLLHNNFTLKMVWLLKWLRYTLIIYNLIFILGFYYWCASSSIVASSVAVRTQTHTLILSCLSIFLINSDSRNFFLSPASLLRHSFDFADIPAEASWIVSFSSSRLVTDTHTHVWALVHSAKGMDMDKRLCIVSTVRVICCEYCIKSPARSAIERILA